MVVSSASAVDAVLPTSGAISALRPISATNVRLGPGFWGDRVRINRERSIPHGFRQLQAVGNLTDLRLAAGTATGRYEALGVMFDGPFPFLDSDVYKWLEAAGWELGRGPDAELAREADEAIELVAAAQRPDGYINTFVQVLRGGKAWQDLAWGHELYCLGHLIQAAVAWHRAVGDDRLLDISVRAADLIDRTLGPNGREAIEGHPEAEMALVELYRVTGERRYLDLAAVLVERRGHGLLGEGRYGSSYWQDHLPVREAPSVAGHAVRQLYLDSGAVDVATELGDQQLLDAVQRRWQDMVATRSYLTGGLGSRSNGEAFGDPFELPPDQAYAETCAAIASVMLSWRLLLATGDPTCADVIERTMLNGVLSGLSLGGTDFFYVNPLQRRTHRAPAGERDGERQPWYACACCPPNLMRVLSSWQQHLATTNKDGIQLHQFATGEITAGTPAGAVRLAVETEYPWDGAVAVRVEETPADEWTLAIRVPGWCQSGAWQIGIGDRRTFDHERTLTERRSWRAGDVVRLELEMPVRVTAPDPRIDAVRGSVALERGPLVYCLESPDLPDGVELEEIAIAADVQPEVVARDDLGPGIVGLTVPTSRRDPGTGAASTPIEVSAIPYFAWANRGPSAMRVWIPTTGVPSTSR